MGGACAGSTARFVHNVYTGNDVLLAQAWNAIGDYYADRQKWLVCCVRVCVVCMCLCCACVCVCVCALCVFVSMYVLVHVCVYVCIKCL